jgi:hypothetical protein
MTGHEYEELFLWRNVSSGAPKQRLFDSINKLLVVGTRTEEGELRSCFWRYMAE